VITRTSAYALEAAIFIAARNGERVTAAELADELAVPANYLSKILNRMARARILESGRGPRGGFRLGREPSSIAIEDVVGLFEDVSGSRRCLLGRGKCTDATGCAMHDRWKKVSGPLFDLLQNTTLASLAADRGRRAQNGATRKRTARARR
jgi:Rrf2 family protein